MISLEAAIAAVLRHAEPLEPCRLPLARVGGLVLAERITAPADLPRFDNSAVDGFGVRLSDVATASPDQPLTLPVSGCIAAGQPGPSGPLPPGTTIKIMTGAVVPAEIEAVVMREQVRETAGFASFIAVPPAGAHIRRRGEELPGGVTLFERGTVISPAVVGVLGTVGRGEVAVHRRPRVALLVTGDELVSPGQTLAAGQIYESNGPALATLLHGQGVCDVDIVRVADRREATTAALQAGLARSDLVITVGGVSVGDHDFVKQCAAALGVEQIYWGIDMKPGKPNYLGVQRRAGSGAALLFGLPGNPVSAQVSCHLLVRPAVRRMLGVPEVRQARIPAVLAEDVLRGRGRREFMRGWAQWDNQRLGVRPLRGQGSHMQLTLARANCLLDIPGDPGRIAAGTVVQIEPLDRGAGPIPPFEPVCHES